MDGKIIVVEGPPGISDVVADHYVMFITCRCGATVLRATPGCKIRLDNVRLTCTKCEEMIVEISNLEVPKRFIP